MHTGTVQTENLLIKTIACKSVSAEWWARDENEAIRVGGTCCCVWLSSAVCILSSLDYWQVNSEGLTRRLSIVKATVVRVCACTAQSSKLDLDNLRILFILTVSTTVTVSLHVSRTDHSIQPNPIFFSPFSFFSFFLLSSFLCGCVLVSWVCLLSCV